MAWERCEYRESMLRGEIDRLRADLAQRTAERDAEAATVASLLRTIALIREAAGVDCAPMLDALPSEVGRIVIERDEARRDACMAVAAQLDAEGRLHDMPVTFIERVRIAREIAAERGWDCYEEVQR